MTKLDIGAGGLVTAPLIAVMYLAGPVADLPFVPFDWTETVLPGAPGTRPEYTAVGNHYQVFLRTELTVIVGSSWSLPITGLVENPVSLTLEDIRDNYITLACISGRVGTDLKKHDLVDRSESSGGTGRRQPDPPVRPT